MGCAVSTFEHSPKEPLAWCELAEPDPDVASVLEAAGMRCGAPEESDVPPVVLLARAVEAPVEERIRCLARGDKRRVVVIAHGRAFTATERWTALEAGASDLLDWDADSTLAQVSAKIARWDEVEFLLASPAVSEHIIGQSPALLSVVRHVVEIAAFTSAPVLITGESGSGKELIARLIHAIDRRAAKGEFVLLDCTTIVPELSGSEFFGHERGAYTGAVGQRDGAFALAHRGTLFLDEVGELPLPLQASLLRVAQEHTYKRVGSNEWRSAEFRLVCATNRDLMAEQSGGGFRRDLYYRIAACMFHLPPLRQRPEDILPLARHFLRQHFPHDEDVDFDDAVSGYLVSREYPGNVRDLKQIVGRLAYRHAGRGKITLGSVPPEDGPQSNRWRRTGAVFADLCSARLHWATDSKTSDDWRRIWPRK
jgi:transcriptional regulator with PAS, ATPase and Fis domain